jgi:hypothetical protein
MLTQNFPKNKIYIFLVWYSSLSRVFIGKSPLQLLSAVTLNLFSEFCSLLGSALPIKILLLISADNIPKYFPLFMLNYGKNTLIYLLTIASIFCWILFILSILYSEKICLLSANKLINPDLNLSNQNIKSAKKAYERYTKSISDLVFSFVAFLTILFFYPGVAFSCLGYLVFFYCFLFFIFSISNSSKLAITRQKIIDWIPASSNIGFFAPFLYMIFDYTRGTSPGLLYALISVILSRQLLRGHMRALRGLNLLYNFKTRHIIEKCYIDSGKTSA